MSSATNCEPPAKTSALIKKVSRLDRPLVAAIAPKTSPIGITATISGAIALKPPQNSSTARVFFTPAISRACDEGWYQTEDVPS
ncbi:hypothetical protein [Sinorhizobium medicae]|uniref:hypothetical protein n=1 Tax=Sinorhizobium medicae TaxID=110321 RepID=UPI002B1BDDAA|nr:hypothetical protein [Sinorhizobium medicae]